MPAGISPREERLAQENIARAQAMARTTAIAGIEAGQLSAASGAQRAAAISASEQEVAQQQALQAQHAIASRQAAARAIEIQNAEQQAAAAEAAQSVVNMATGEEESLVARQAFKAAKKKAEFLQQQISDRMENLAESTGESFVLSGMIYIVLAIWVVVRVMRTILVKSEKGFMGIVAALVPPYSLGQMLLAAVVVVVGLMMFACLLLIATIVVITIYDMVSSIMNWIPAPFRDMLLKAFGIPSL